VSPEILRGFLAWTPVLLVLVLATGFRTQALTLGMWGYGYTALLALLAFDTGPRVVLLASLDGMLTTLPLLLVVYGGILLSVLLLEKGALQRLALWLSGDGLRRVPRAVLLSFGVGNFLEGAGVVAEPVAAPMLLASGIGPKPSAALSIVGYAGLMHLSLAGVIVTVLASATGLPVRVLARDLGILSFPAVLLLCFSVPCIMDVPGRLKESFPVLLATGLLASSAALLCAAYVGYSIAGMLAGMAAIAFFYLLARRLPRKTPTLRRDLLPFAFLFVCLACVNLIPPLRELAFNRWVVSLDLVPRHTVRLRPFFDAYPYLFLAFLLAFALHRGPGDRMRDFIKKANPKAARAVVAMALFGAMGQVIACSGYADGFEHFRADRNMAACLARGAMDATGEFYLFLAPLLGWAGTFLTGYGVASIMLFGKLQMEAAPMLGISPSFLACALTVGASVGSVSSPFKIAIATPLCGAQGKEGEILRKTIPLGLAVSLGVGLFAWGWIRW